MAMIGGINTAISGMKMNQAQLDVVGRNIVNVNTVGYTKKFYQQHNVVLDRQGAGATLSNVMRTVDESLLKSFLSGNSNNAKFYSESKYLSKMEDFIGSPLGDNSLSSNVSDLNKMIENLAINVSSAAARYELINSAETLANRLNSLTSSVQKLRAEADQEITQNIEEVNELLGFLKELNIDVVKSQALGYEGLPDLLDQRDMALRELSQYIDISYFSRENGELVIQTGDGITLLDKDVHKLSHTPASQTNSLTAYNGGGISGIYVDGKDITTKIKNGSIKGLINVRDTALPSLQSQLDELAGTMKNAINKEHNMGTAFPNLVYSLEGTKTFIDSSVQNIKIENGDVRFTIFDSDGKQISTASLGQDLGFTQGTVDTMTTALENWLQSPTGGNLPQATAKIDADGHFIIDTGDSNYTISIMDVSSSQLGANQSNVTVKFDADGDGVFDESTEGFSNFFGLNDFFITNTNEYVYDSKVLSKTVSLGITTPVTLSFSDKTNGAGFASITLNPGDNLQRMVDKINNDPALNENIKATLVPSGNGYVLRIINTSGEQLEITETGSTSGIMQRLGLEHSNAESSKNLKVRDDLLSNPGLIAVGAPQFDENSGMYILSASSNEVINSMAKTFSGPTEFTQTGNLSSMSSSFADYASTFVGVIASSKNSADRDLKYQTTLLEAISTKEAQISSVDMDTELAMMIVFKQSYDACAQAFNVSKAMIDTILGMV